MPQVSVVVPVYNMENYIERCVSSLTGQTLKDIEVILVDDVIYTGRTARAAIEATVRAGPTYSSPEANNSLSHELTPLMQTAADRYLAAVRIADIRQKTAPIPLLFMIFPPVVSVYDCFCRRYRLKPSSSPRQRKPSFSRTCWLLVFFIRVSAKTLSAPRTSKA